MMALKRAIRTTAMTASRTRPMEMPGRSHAVSRNDTVDTSRVITRRLMSAHGPPRHSHRMRAWVA